MATYHVDPLHPDRLACELCGEIIGAIDPAPGDPLGGLTLEQALQAWPGLANDLCTHDVLCSWRQAGGLRADGAGVYVHTTERGG